MARKKSIFLLRIAKIDDFDYGVETNTSILLVCQKMYYPAHNNYVERRVW